MLFSFPSSFTSTLCTDSVFFLHFWHLSRMTLRLRFLQCINQLLGLLPVFTYVLPVSWHLVWSFFFSDLIFFFFLLFVTPCSEIPFAFPSLYYFFLAFCRRLYWLSAYILLISCIRSSILHSLIFPFSFALGPLIALERLYTCPCFFFVLFISPLVKTPASFFWLLFFSA